jgi:hypothetical protein
VFHGEGFRFNQPFEARAAAPSRSPASSIDHPGYQLFPRCTGAVGVSYAF